MRFTVLTATYNRAHTLARVYESLCSQTFRDFEWIIVDDGSSDGTKELVASWKTSFPLRYTWKKNGGKHTAFNVGVKQASGELLLTADSDDRFVPHALERFHFHWQQIPNRERFAGACGLCYESDGATIHGSQLKADYVDCFTLAECMAQNGPFERWGFMRTDLLRQFPYPEFRGERFMIEGVVWNRILRRYALRFFNEPLRIYEQTCGSLSQSGDLRWENPKGAVVYYFEMALTRGIPARERLKSVLNLSRFAPVAALRTVGL
jgi:glycosyltransferase involved in cell wall biosynthesis